MVSRDGDRAFPTDSLWSMNRLLRVLWANLSRTPEWPLYMSVHSLSIVLRLNFTWVLLALAYRVV